MVMTPPRGHDSVHDFIEVRAARIVLAMLSIPASLISPRSGN